MATKRNKKYIPFFLFYILDHNHPLFFPLKRYFDLSALEACGKNDNLKMKAFTLIRLELGRFRVRIFGDLLKLLCYYLYRLSSCLVTCFALWWQVSWIP